MLLGEPSPTPYARVLVHLGLLMLLGLVIADRLAPLLRTDWFENSGWSLFRRRIGGAIVLVIVPTGTVALVTLASAAALRFDPSLQFLQLLSALDIVWGMAAVLYGLHLIEDRTTSRASAVVFAAVCIGALWLYLDVVGFTPSGGWLVDGGELFRLVIPADMAGAVVATTILWVGIRRSVRAEEQARD